MRNSQARSQNLQRSKSSKSGKERGIPKCSSRSNVNARSRQKRKKSVKRGDLMNL